MRWLSMIETEAATGVTRSNLRMWELRYGWPVPQRGANGFRRFSPSQVEEIRQVQALVRRGAKISQLVVDGRPLLPAPARRATLDRLAFMQQPDDRALAADQVALIEALRAERGGAVGLLVQADRCCRPLDLVRFFYRPARLAMDQWSAAGVNAGLVAAMRAVIAQRCSELRQRYGSRLLQLLDLDEALFLWVNEMARVHDEQLA